MTTLIFTALMVFIILVANRVLSERHYAGGPGYWPFIVIDAAAFTILVLALGHVTA